MLRWLNLPIASGTRASSRLATPTIENLPHSFGFLATGRDGSAIEILVRSITQSIKSSPL
jgi:hypothetical protein